MNRKGFTMQNYYQNAIFLRIFRLSCRNKVFPSWNLLCCNREIATFLFDCAMKKPRWVGYRFLWYLGIFVCQHWKFFHFKRRISYVRRNLKVHNYIETLNLSGGLNVEFGNNKIAVLIKKHKSFLDKNAKFQIKLEKFFWQKITFARYTHFQSRFFFSFRDFSLFTDFVLSWMYSRIFRFFISCKKSMM